MQRVPGRAKISASSRVVSVLAKTEHDADLLVPDGLEEIDQISLRRVLPPTLYHESAVVKILQAQRFGFSDISSVVVQPVGEAVTLLGGRLRRRVGRVGLSDINGVLAGRNRFVS